MFAFFILIILSVALYFLIYLGVYFVNKTNNKSSGNIDLGDNSIKENTSDKSEQIKNQINELVTQKFSIYEITKEKEQDEEIQLLFPIKTPNTESKVRLSNANEAAVEDLVFKIKHDEELKQFLPGENRTLCKYVSLEGQPGTGKTMLAEEIAKKVGKNILIADYQKISSKYVGDTEKRLDKLFNYADEKNAVLFIDEADTLLSSRISNAQSSNDLYVNSTRSAILTKLNNYPGIVIFASNFAQNYDNAIKSRVIKITIENSPLVRYGIWFDQLEKIEDKLCDDIPVGPKERHKKDLNAFNCTSLRECFSCILANEYKNLVGRDIRKIVEDVLVRAAKESEDDFNNLSIKYEYFTESCSKYTIDPVSEFLTNLKKIYTPVAPYLRLGEKGINYIRDYFIKIEENKKYKKEENNINQIEDDTIISLIEDIEESNNEGRN